MAVSFFDSSAPAGVDGLFIPITALPGITSGELAAGEPSSKKHSKLLFSLLDKLVSGYNPVHLGFSISKLKPVVSENFINQSFAVKTQMVVDLINDSLEVIPVPTSGDNSGIGDFSLTDYLPGASILDSLDDTGGAGVLFPIADLALHGHSASGLSTDDRKILFALISLITYSNDFAIRSSSPAVSSAIITKSNGIISITELPSNSYAVTNPTTGLLLTNKERQPILQRDYTYTLQLSLSALTTEINYV